MNEAGQRLRDLVLTVHHRNGGKRAELDWDWPLLAPELGLDSMDLAEIMVAVEREFGVDPFGGTTVPRTWGEVRALIIKRAAER